MKELISTIRETGKFRKNGENHPAELMVDENECVAKMWLILAEPSARFFGTFASMAKVHSRAQY